MLVADLADEGVRDFLSGVALAQQVAYVPLLSPPVDRTTHSLEVYTPEATEPLRLLADPVGPPTADGFPLRLRHVAGESATAIKVERKRPPTLRARHETSHKLSDRHTADLEGEPIPLHKRDTIVGRALANGKLQIEALIGGGGVGAVYRATHRELRIPVAVKVLHDTYQADVDFGRRFHAEALAASRLDHPNITRVLDFGQETDGLLYLVMEYLDGVGLRTVLEREKQLTTERIIRLGLQVCAGLAHAHARNIVHKDIKPENLVILQGSDDDGVPMEIVKVCDFGIAQGIVEETRRFQGTPEYMSPEQCRSETLDARSDVYSVGVVLYELVSGDVPFSGEEISHIVWRQLNEAPEPPSMRARGVDPRLERVIMRSLAKDPNGRYPSMRDLRTALRELLDKPPTSLSGQHPRVVVPASSRAPRISAAPELLVRQEPPSLSTSSSRPPTPSSSTRPASSTPPWLIHGGAYSQVFEAAGGGASVASPRSELLSDPSAFMRRLVAAQDPAAFAELAAPLESAIKDLASASDVETLWRLASTLDMLASEGP